MPERKLQIVKKQSPDTIGVCEGCNQQFTSHLPQADKAEWEINTLFSRHKCKPEDASQASSRWGIGNACVAKGYEAYHWT